MLFFGLDDGKSQTQSKDKCVKAAGSSTGAPDLTCLLANIGSFEGKQEHQSVLDELKSLFSPSYRLHFARSDCVVKTLLCLNVIRAL